MKDQSLTVSEVLARAERVIGLEFPTPVWVRGEVTGLRRTSGGAVFFRLADPDVDHAALDVLAMGRVMRDVDRVLESAGLGALRDGVELRINGTVGVATRQSLLRMTLLAIDPAFTMGRLAVVRAEVLQKMSADGSLRTNAKLPIPPVPLRIGLVTSRGSAAHADFIHQLERSGFRFAVRTAHTSVQGDEAPEAVAKALAMVAKERVDMAAVIRGGGAKLDLSVFDSEVVGRAISKMPVPVITGLGHEVDRTIADEAAAISEKTPSAVGEWLVARVKDFSDRLGRARLVIGTEARSAFQRHRQRLVSAAGTVASVSTSLARQRDLIDHVKGGIADSARRKLQGEERNISNLGEWFSAIGLNATLGRGFAVVTKPDGRTVIRSVDQVSAGDSLVVRVGDGTFPVKVEGQ